MGGSKRKTHISSNIKDVQAYMKERVGVGISYDLEFRELVLLKRKVQLYFLNGQVSDLVAIEIIKKLVEIVENRLANLSVEHTNTMDEAVDQMLSGLIIVFVDGEKKAFIVDVRDYPGRQPEEPDTERVIRGSRDGFTENVIINTAL